MKKNRMGMISRECKEDNKECRSKLCFQLEAKFIITKSKINIKNGRENKYILTDYYKANIFATAMNSLILYHIIIDINININI